MSVKVTTNNVPRDVIYWHELTNSERAKFDYVQGETAEGDFSGFRYKGNVYDLGEFMATTVGGDFDKWDGVQSDTYFSGVLVRYVENFERVIVASYFA